MKSVLFAFFLLSLSACQPPANPTLTNTEPKKDSLPVQVDASQTKPTTALVFDQNAPWLAYHSEKGYVYKGASVEEAMFQQLLTDSFKILQQAGKLPKDIQTIKIDFDDNVLMGMRGNVRDIVQDAYLAAQK